MPKITVIVPVYKVEQYLNRCVDSILNQTFSDFELILVDDGSPDNCPAICDEYAKKDNRIVVIHKENGGLSSARNAGLDWMYANSNSEWLTFIDSDDWVHKQYLEIMHNAVIKTGYEISTCRLKYVNSYIEDEVLENIEPELIDSYVLAKSQYSSVLCGCIKLIKRQILENIRFPIGKINEDTYTTYKFMFLRDKICFVDCQLYYYYENQNSIMRTKWTKKRLDVFEAGQYCIDYFVNNNKPDLTEWAVYHYYGYINVNYKDASSYKENKESLKIIHKLAIEAYKKYGKKYPIEYKKMPYCRVALHPIVFAKYPEYVYYKNEAKWLFIAFKNKIKRMFRLG